MNKLTKIATTTGLVGLGILLLIMIFGIGHPNPLFNYGVGIGLILIFAAIVLYVIGWIIDFKDAITKRNLIGALILILAAVLFVYQFLK